MALPTLTREEVGFRVQSIRMASGLRGRELMKSLGSTDPGLATKLEQGKSRVIERLPEIADACAGKGMLKKIAPEEVLAFLRGDLDELPVVLDGRFRYMSYCHQVRFGGELVVLPRRNSQADDDRDVARAAA